jgi:hypothetical protein
LGVSLAVIQGAAWLLSSRILGRSVEIDYGAFVMDKLLSVLRGNAGDGLWPLAALADAASGPLQPLIVVLAYCVAYMPLIALATVHAATAWRKSPPALDLVLIGTYGCGIAVALWVVEGGADGRNSWNVAAHLHYLIPLLAVVAAARLLGPAHPLKVRRVAMVVTAAVAVWGAVNIASGASRFEFWRTWSIDEPDMVHMLRRIDAETEPDAVVLPIGLAPELADEYVAMLTNRSLLVSRSFAYASAYPDASAREAMAQTASREWPAERHLSRSGLQDLRADRSVVLAGRLPPGSVPPRDARCVGEYCFWVAQ